MKQQNNSFGMSGKVITCIVLVCVFIFTTCDLQGAKVEVIDAAMPEFISEPASQSVEPNEYTTLIAEAKSPDGGVISYQWYSLPREYDSLDEGNALAGKTDDTLDVKKVLEGVFLFYVEVTNTNAKANGKRTASLTSNVIVVSVESSDSWVKYPIITQQPVSTTVQVGPVDLNIEVEQADRDQGTLSYQWYSVNGTGNKGGARIDGARASTCTITISEPGESNFYCVVTSSNGDESKSITSQTATITTIAELIPNATIVVNPSRKYQYVRGFGGMDAPWVKRIKLDEYEKMFNPDTGLGLNILRTMIMPENPDDNTNPAKTNDYYINGGGDWPLMAEGIKIVNKYGGYVLASPWSPPPDWKSNSSKNGGGHLLPEYYDNYAKYLRDYCKDMYDRGAPVYVVSIQNEPNFTATYDGCEWTSEEMRDFFIKVGHFTTVPNAIPGWGGGKATPHVLTMNGESANHPNINDRAMDNDTSRAVIDMLGRHTYGDALNRYGKALDVEPKREVWMTEHNINSGNAIAYPNDSTWNYVWLFLNDLDLSIRQNDESAFVWWYIKRFYSVIGDGEYGTVEGQVYPRGYGLSQYAKYAKEMWRCGVVVQGETKDGSEISSKNVNPTGLSRTTQHVRVTGFVSADGNTLSLVMYTPTDTSGKNGIDMGTVKIQLPKDFIVDKADAMRSTATSKAKKESVMLSQDNNSALVMLPPSTILSVRFTKK